MDAAKKEKKLLESVYAMQLGEKRRIFLFQLLPVNMRSMLRTTLQLLALVESRKANPLRLSKTASQSVH